MTKLRVAINGFGRIGRLCFRNMIQDNQFEVVAINDLADVKILSHLLKYDSVHGKLDTNVSVSDTFMLLDGHKVQVCKEKDPSQLPWEELKVDVVIESTGVFTNEEGARKHLTAGAKKVVISAPAKGNIKTIVLGVNRQELKASDEIVSNASCTTNCLAPLVKVVDDSFGIEKGYLSTIHAYTSDQNIQDAPHRDFRRSRAAALSIIPTTTGAASAVGKVLPHLEGKLDGMAMRVPIPDGSMVDFTAILKCTTTKEELNDRFISASENSLKGIIEYSIEPLVSADILGNAHSAIVDSQFTAVNGNLVKIVAWYDNEYAYSCRAVELVSLIAKLEI